MRGISRWRATKRIDSKTVRRVAVCTTVRETARVPTTDLSTGDYPEDMRVHLGREVRRVRRAAGIRSKEALAKAAGISARSVSKLEQPVGELPVGSSVLEAVARVLPGWTEDTPRRILEGEPTPAPTSSEQSASESPATVAIQTHSELSDEDKARLDILKSMISVDELKAEIRWQLLAHLLEAEGVEMTPHAVLTFLTERAIVKRQKRSAAGQREGDPIH